MRPSDDGQATRVGVDGTTFLTIYVILLVAVPSRLVLAPLGAAGTPAQVFGMAGLAWWLLHRVLHRDRDATARPLRTALLLLVLCILASFVKACMRPIDAAEMSAAQMGLLSLSSWAGVLLVAHDGITSRDRLVRLLRRFSVAAGCLGLLGLLQFVSGRAYVDLIQIPGLVANIPLNGVGSRDGLYRPAGTALSPIEFGVFLTIALPVALYFALEHPVGGRLRRWLPVVMIGAAVPLSISRSAIIGTIIVLACLLPSWPVARRYGAGVAVGITLMAVFVLVPGMLGSILKLFTGIGDDESAASRTDSYPLAWEFITRDPFFGRGFLTFLPKYRILDNQYLGLLIDVGVVGLAAVLGLFGVAIVVAVRERRRDGSDRALPVTLVAAVAAGAASLAFFDAFSFPIVTGSVFLLIGMIGAVGRTRVPPSALISGST